MTTLKWALTLALMALTGCATAKMATPESDAAAKRFVVPEGKANLYVARSGGSYAPTTSFNVVVDGKVIGAISPGTFLLVAIDPGTHAVAATSIEGSSRASFEAVAGKNYFFEVTASGSGPMASPGVGLVLLEEMGKLMVRQAKRVQGTEE